MLDNDSLDDIRRQIQESLAQSKREKLREEFGMLDDYTDPRLSPEAQNDFLDYILEFERQFENAQRISVRERIGNPTIQPVEEIPLLALEETVDKLLELLLNTELSWTSWVIGTIGRLIVSLPRNCWMRKWTTSALKAHSVTSMRQHRNMMCSFGWINLFTTYFSRNESISCLDWSCSLYLTRLDGRSP